MTRLISCKLDVSLPDGLGSLGNVVCDRPAHNMRGWRILLRGPAVLLVSPPGWEPGVAPPMRKGTAVAIYELPRSQCVLRWEGADGIDAIQKHDTPPMWTADERAAIEAAELERQTAPAVKRP